MLERIGGARAEGASEARVVARLLGEARRRLRLLTRC